MVFHNPISTNSSITSSNINPSTHQQPINPSTHQHQPINPSTHQPSNPSTHQPINPSTHQHHQPINPYPSINTSNTTTPTTIPSTPTTSEIRHQHSKYAFERTFQVWGKSKLACSYVQANHASSAKFLRSPALSTGQAIGASLPSLTHGPLGGGLFPPHCVFARVDTQLLQAINDTRVQISDCTLHTTTTATTTTTPASPNLSITSINSSTYTTGTSAIWGSMGIHTPIDNYQYSPRPTPQSAPSSSSSSSDFSFSSFFHFSPDTRFEPQISVAHSKIPDRPRTQWKKTPLPAGPPPQTPTQLLLVAHPPRPIYRCVIFADLRARLQSHALEAPQEQSITHS
ncbi:hypothetical protein BASA83_013775 [Batrachochytrium salamandrivorans]|nr:hypothetical protein BASA83_013775 [Batrachochytrium salamandrivorans]